MWARLKAEGEGATENEVVGWHRRLDGHEFEQVPGGSDGKYRNLQFISSVEISLIYSGDNVAFIDYVLIKDSASSILYIYDINRSQKDKHRLEKNLW